MDILNYSQELRETAFEILESSELIQLWEAIGAEVYVVGALKTGLLIHRDIDIHVYTGEVSVSESFSVMAKLAERMTLTELQYKNGLETEEECVEWHALFEDRNKNCWKLDLIHIRKGSVHDGVVERVADRIAGKLTPELRKRILQIKYDMPQDALIPGIEVYHAVFTGNVKTYEELLQWRQTNPLTDSLGWMP